MSIIIGIIIPAILFIATLPLQSVLFLSRQSLKLEEIKERKRRKGRLRGNSKFSRGTASLRARLGLSSKNDSSCNVPSEFKSLSLKSKRLFLKGLSLFISFLRSVASVLLALVATAVTILIPVSLSVIIASSSIIMFLDSNGKSKSYVGVNAVAESSVVEGNQAPSGWLGSVETMGRWYLSNINTYQRNTTGKGSGNRKWYPCDLVGGSNVGDDCTGFAYACLVYSGYIQDSPTSAPPSSDYIKNGSMIGKLESVGFKHGTVTADTVFEAGDILSKEGHVEIVVGKNPDGTYNTFGWGDIHSEYPSSKNVPSAKLTSRYSDYFRLTK